MLFDYPQATHFGRVIPKTKIYQYAKPKSALRQALVDEVEKIIWRHKLSPATLNLPASRRVGEVQILEIHPKGAEVSDAVLACIDKAIGFPLIFELHSPRGWQVRAAIKTPSTNEIADGSNRPARPHSLGPYMTSDWVRENEPRQPLPVALNLGGLYQQLLAPLLPYPLQKGEDLWQAGARFEKLVNLQKQLQQVQNRLHREAHFKRKIELNQEQRNLQKALATMIGGEGPGPKD